MTKLYMKQKVFSWRSRFTIKDAYEQDRFTVEGEFVKLGKRLHIYDANCSEAARIEQKVFSFRPRFYVYIGERFTAEIVREYSFMRPNYTIHGLDWLIEGDFWQHEYRITDRTETIVRVSKEWISWGDSYCIDILRDADTIPALSVVLAIDCLLDQQAVVASV